MTYYPDLAVPGAAAAVRSFVELTVESGVRRLVLLSGRGKEEAQVSEQTVRDSGLDWMILRSSWFNQNFSENFLLGGVLSGVLTLPVDGVREPFVDADDIADVAAMALTEPGHTGQAYELTGPRLLTFAEAVQEIAETTGRELRFQPIPMDEYASLLARYGVPAETVALMTYLFSEVLDGRNAYLTDGIQRALGCEPKDFSDYARATAATGVCYG